MITKVPARKFQLPCTDTQPITTTPATTTTPAPRICKLQSIFAKTTTPAPRVCKLQSIFAKNSTELLETCDELGYCVPAKRPRPAPTEEIPTPPPLARICKLLITTTTSPPPRKGTTLLPIPRPIPPPAIDIGNLPRNCNLPGDVPIFDKKCNTTVINETYLLPPVCTESSNGSCSIEITLERPPKSHSEPEILTESQIPKPPQIEKEFVDSQIPKPPTQTEDESIKNKTRDCYFRINGDLNKNHPIMTYHGTLDWLLPDTNGTVVIKTGQTIDMYCTKSFVQPFSYTRKLSATCLHDYEYMIYGKQFTFSSFDCIQKHNFFVERTGTHCNGGTELLRVGFDLPDGFLTTMDICFDEENKITRYVRYSLYPSSIAFERDIRSPKFLPFNFYKNISVDNWYKQNRVLKTFSSILGMDASRYLKNIITRGHLAARSDFIYASAQYNTYIFINAAPQWMDFNSGNWKEVENGVQSYLAIQGITADVYTGVWGITTLPDVNNTQKELFLTFDKNNKGLIPVPKIYFRIVIDVESRKGLVLIGVNNINIPLEQVLAEYVICEDIGENINWINWSKDNIMMGYSYACSVPDFLTIVKDLPLEDLQTTGILGVE